MGAVTGAGADNGVVVVFFRGFLLLLGVVFICKVKMRVEKLDQSQKMEALELAWRVFQEFEASDYSQEGIDEFHNFVSKVAPTADMQFWGAFHGERMVGMAATRVPQHLSLFFVDKEFHRQGVGRSLFEALLREFPTGPITVNSSPYAAPIYPHYGFVPTSGEQVVNGIRFVPMVYRCHEGGAGQ
ncbi:MAG: GNAT family N-acetyltransferase [Paludibacteraceae bacterium]|nr:GNAT family N-acetyltransferase [Paludibacteraceae bacterium]